MNRTISPLFLVLFLVRLSAKYAKNSLNNSLYQLKDEAPTDFVHVFCVFRCLAAPETEAQSKPVSSIPWLWPIIWFVFLMH